MQGDNTINATFSQIPEAIFSTCSSVTYEAPSGAVNNIVFTFDKPYTCGQFANGDWWVSPDSAGGTVRVVSITPDGIVGKHGVEINPSSTTTQAFDNQADGSTYNGSLLATFPRDVSGGSSIVKTVSVLIKPSRPELQFAGVLTVVDTPIANSAEVFRPAYFGSKKTFYNTGAIQISKLPKYNATSLSSVAGITIESVANRYKNVQLDHVSGWVGRDVHPKDNMPDYGATIATDNGANLLRMLLDDFNYSNPAHKQALVNYLQMAIDLQAFATGGSSWSADGGHMNGRKLPLIFAEWLMNDTSFRSAINATKFSEDQQVWRSPVTGLVLYGDAAVFGTPESAYWKTTITSNAGAGPGTMSGSRTIRDPYGYIDGGGFEIGIGYQFATNSKPWKYTVLALYMLGLESAWSSNTDLIDYVERWVSSGVIALPDPCATYDGIATNYGITYGPDSANPGQCIKGSGRWPAKHGINVNGGYYGSTFGEQLWTWYKANN